MIGFSFKRATGVTVVPSIAGENTASPLSNDCTVAEFLDASTQEQERVTISFTREWLATARTRFTAGQMTRMDEKWETYNVKGLGIRLQQYVNDHPTLRLQQLRKLIDAMYTQIVATE